MIRSDRPPSVKISKKLTVLNPVGLHARPAAEFVQLVRAFRSSINIVRKDGSRLMANRVLEVLIGDLGCGEEFTLEAEGSDAEAAVQRLSQLLIEFRDRETDSSAGV